MSPTEKSLEIGHLEPFSLLGIRFADALATAKSSGVWVLPGTCLLETQVMKPLFEVPMSGRRSYARFNITPSSEGVLRVLRDVTVQHVQNDEVVVVGREAGVIGEIMTIESTEPATIDGRVRVVESFPIIVDGAVRHRLRLHRVPPLPHSLNLPVDSYGRSL